MIGFFGWYGRLDSRETRGELQDSTPILPIEYIPYDEELFQRVAESTRLDFLTFRVSLEERTMPPTTSEPTRASTSVSIELLVGVAVGAVVAVLIVVLIVVIVCVFGRRRHQQPKSK